MSAEQTIEFAVSDEDDGARLDALLARESGGSRSAAAAWCEQDRVRVRHEGRQLKPAKSLKVPAGAVITARVPEPEEAARVVAQVVDGFSICLL
ncbi:hypothetical protein ILP97_63475, partial [Amycolatopsis sp. H6(2020)]|nr:hypothetical protein [Amycolatopsis sp. H6(2020)]